MCVCSCVFYLNPSILQAQTLPLKTKQHQVERCRQQEQQHEAQVGGGFHHSHSFRPQQQPQRQHDGDEGGGGQGSLVSASLFRQLAVRCLGLLLYGDGLARVWACLRVYFN